MELDTTSNWSLTAIFNYHNKEFRDLRSFLSETFPKPKQKLERTLIVPSASVSPGLIGTAFDYLLRFHLEKKYNRKVVCNPWVAEQAVYDYFHDRHLGFQSVEFEKKLTARDIERLFAIKKRVPRKFKWCKEVHSRFIHAKENELSQLLEVCLFLAKLDNIYRRGLPTIEEFKTLLNVKKHDVAELRSLIDCCSIDQFKPTAHIILNPGFNTDIVSADADLIVDEMLIDVKVTKHLKLIRKHFNQLIGYYLLYLIDGIQTKPKVKISKLAIYFARYDFLWSIDVKDVGNTLQFRKAATILKRSLRK